jgi:hypothetical protein
MSVQCLTSSTVLNCEGGSLGLEGEQNNKQGTDKKSFLWRTEFHGFADVKRRILFSTYRRRVTRAPYHLSHTQHDHSGQHVFSIGEVFLDKFN